MEPPKSRMNIMKRYELMLGAISRKTIRQVEHPLSRARSTNSRVRSEKVCARIARAAHGHEVRPMNSPCTATERTPR